MRPAHRGRWPPSSSSGSSAIGLTAGQFGGARRSPHESVSANGRRRRHDDRVWAAVHARPHHLRRARAVRSCGARAPTKPRRSTAPGRCSLATWRYRPVRTRSGCCRHPTRGRSSSARNRAAFTPTTIRSADLGRIEFHKRALTEPVEQLTFAITKNPGGKGGTIAMTWEKTEVSVPFTVGSKSDLGGEPVAQW